MANRFISLSITKETQPLSQAGFGVLLIMTAETPTTLFGASNRTKLYSGDDILTDVGKDFGTSSSVYKAVNSLLAQQIKVPSVRIGKRDSVVAQVKRITWDADFVTGNTIQGTLNGTTIDVDFDTDQSTTIGLIATAMAAAEGIDTAVATAGSGSGGYIDITADDEYTVDIGTFVTIGGASQADATVTTTTAGRTIIDDISDAIDEADDWYGIMEVGHLKGAQISTALWAQANEKLFGFSTTEAGAKAATTTDVIAYVNAKGYDHTFSIWHHNADTEYPEAAVFGNLFPKTVGRYATYHKGLTGITPTPISSLDSSGIANILGKYGNVYTEIGGLGTFYEGRLSNGDFIDNTRDIDYLKSKLIENMWSTMRNKDKISMTQKGIDFVGNVFKRTLEREVARDYGDGFEVGIIEPGSILYTYPLKSAISQNDKANRLVTGYEFSFALAGGILTVGVNIKAQL